MQAIELTSIEIEIMGKPNFACARVARLLIDSGLYKKGPEKAEYEQAVFIHWALLLKDLHGDDWKTHGENILNECHQNLNKSQVKTQ